MPGTPRIVVEMAFLLALVFGENVLMVSPLAAAVLLAAELALGMALVRPWAPVHGGLASRVVATVLVVVAVAAPAAVEHPGFAGASRQLGVEIAAGTPERKPQTLAKNRAIKAASGHRAESSQTPTFTFLHKTSAEFQIRFSHERIGPNCSCVGPGVTPFRWRVRSLGLVVVSDAIFLS